jgi:hypothetical protein
MAEFPHAFLKNSLLGIVTGAAAEQPEKARAVITASAFALKIKLLKHNKFEREFLADVFDEYGNYSSVTVIHQNCLTFPGIFHIIIRLFHTGHPAL